MTEQRYTGHRPGATVMRRPAVLVERVANREIKDLGGHTALELFCQLGRDMVNLESIIARLAAVV
jgi:hypothetical protein